MDVDDTMHDWTLAGITVRWRERQVEIVVVDDAKKRHVISVLGFTRVHVPREEPWGPSVSVNRVRIAGGEGENKKVTLEMQSGDAIEADGASVSVSETTMSEPRER
jgi:hypothetical protein